MAVSLPLAVALGALMIDAILELSFITSMVAWLHNTASGTFTVNFNESTFELYGEPKHFLVNQGHTSNGAAGTAIVLIGFGGIVTLFLRSRPHILGQKFTSFIYGLWLTILVLGLMLTIAALGYVFAVTNAHKGQTIDVKVASTTGNHKYPLDTWTPQNWFPAVLKLDLANESQRNDIASHLRIMRGWQYNLIPMFLIQLTTTVLAFLEFLERRRSGPSHVAYGAVERSSAEQKMVATP
ncbi:uncharacterized protein TrAFT101_011609 [Trichoderma asperellum]|uniref:Uncharacterized protein n=1 Tax=Trichoderma asperellum (strain ATCC 204424 / CBS 433.97 / NBRC 101777) TaxID=1042311 RepID=A0A2T3Z0J3_TRIA4|nr:hypothetical protein M441DRAFT_60546 [Trichoderma asperellum CBS 433.97]PTB38290.1 hypothetical protein M441DRAFT_60546 [Trichoderma asperellum CBS 433.97]UKZ96832.1 hypothetical protein TrAFT101_011609 [Trichoderma asperellum]